MSFFSVANSDPTAPIGFATPDLTKKKKAITHLPRLDAILCEDQKQCFAILNDQAVNKGQSVNGYVISAISENNVTVKRGNRRWSLVLFNEQVIQ